MAKDKGKKTSTTEDEFGKPSDAPAGGDGWKLTDARDCLVLFKPLREEQKPAFGKAGKEGEKQDVIIADAVVLTNKKGKPLAEPEEHDEAWIFQKFIQGSLRGYIGDRLVLGVVRNTETTTKATSASGGFYWELEDATPEQVEIAKAYRASLDPFAQKKGAKVKDKKAKDFPEPEPKKKDKKKGKK